MRERERVEGKGREREGKRGKKKGKEREGGVLKLIVQPTTTTVSNSMPAS